MPHLPRKERKRPWNKERKAHARRTNDNQQFYNSKAWRMTSKRNIANNPLCKICEDESRVTGATCTDHIVPINDGGSEFDPDNHQSLCDRHHNQKSGREAHSSTRK